METLQDKPDKIFTIGVDVQNDFCPGGKLAVNNGDQVITPLNRLFNYTRNNNGFIIATGDQHPAKSPHFDLWPIHCIAGTYGAEIRDDLDVRANDIIINKGMGQTNGYSGFEGLTDKGQTIESIVYPKDRERIAILIGGLATDYCVLNTVMDALNLAERVRKSQTGKIAVYAIEDAMRAVNLKIDDGRNALEAMQKAGAIIINSADIIENNILRIN